MSRKACSLIYWSILCLLAISFALCMAGCTGGGRTAATVPFTAVFREIAVPVAGNSPTDPIPGCWPDDLRSDAAGNIWFAQHHSNEIGRMSPAGVYTGFPIPTPNSVMDSLVVDEARRLVWVTENNGNKIVRLDMDTGRLIEIQVPTPNSTPGDITLAPDGMIWFDEGYEGGTATTRIARLDPATNAITEFTPTIPRNGTDGITVAPTGEVWFVELYDNRISRFTNGQFTEFILPRPNVFPTNIAIDARGQVWVTEQIGNAIAILDPSSGVWRELPIPTPNSYPLGIIIDQRGSVWFTESATDKIGVVPAGTTEVLDFSVPNRNSRLEDICVTTNGSIYFTEQYGNKIGQITIPGLTPP